MEKWDIVVVIAALVGLFASVITPLIKLTRAITRLTTTMEAMERNLLDLTTDSRNNHERLWAHEQVQDNKLCDHESRIRVIEDDR